MIEIIVHGKFGTNKPRYRKKCGTCKTIFTYQKSDREIWGYTADDWHYGVKCPVCSRVLLTSIFDRREKNK